MLPMFQVQLTAPEVSDVLAVSPCAELGPLLYVTTMVQATFGAVDTAANPVAFRDTGDRTDVKMTPTGFPVGAAVVGARVAGVCVTDACVTDACVGAPDSAGANVAAVCPPETTLWF